MPPQTHYAKVGDSHVAYQVVGDGPIDLVFTINWFGHLDMRWEEPATARFLDRLASFSRLILFDKRGTGLSDPVPLDEIPTLEDWVDDLIAVMDAVGSQRAAQLGVGSGGMMSLLFAATHPERASNVVVFNTFARVTKTDDYPCGFSEEQSRMLTMQQLAAFTGTFPAETAEREASHPGYYSTRLSRYLRSSASPGTWAAIAPRVNRMDVRAALPSVHVPTLAIYRGAYPFRPWRDDAARYLTDRTPNARLLVLPGDEGLWMFGDTETLLGEIEEFITGTRSTAEPDRVLATVMFTDIVGSTERIAAIGDAKWRSLLREHDQRVREQLARFNGRQIATAGDGFLVTFDGPARAIRCARSIVDAIRSLGLEVRVGLHAGEVEVVGADIQGMAVHIAARVAALAGPGEVLVSSTVKDLVAGSGPEFDDRGEHQLKGVPGVWRLFSVI